MFVAALYEDPPALLVIGTGFDSEWKKEYDVIDISIYYTFDKTTTAYTGIHMDYYNSTLVVLYLPSIMCSLRDWLMLSDTEQV